MSEEREKVTSWYNIAAVFGVHEATVKRWCRTDPLFRRAIRRFRGRVFAYRDDLEYWRKQREEAWETHVDAP